MDDHEWNHLPYLRTKGESMKALRGKITLIRVQVLEERAALSSHTGARTEPQIQYERRPWQILALRMRQLSPLSSLASSGTSRVRSREKGTGSAVQAPKAPCQTQVHVLVQPRHDIFPHFPFQKGSEKGDITTPAHLHRSTPTALLARNRPLNVRAISPHGELANPRARKPAVRWRALQRLVVSSPCVLDRD